jgi:hypothetical protein
MTRSAADGPQRLCDDHHGSYCRDYCLMISGTSLPCTVRGLQPDARVGIVDPESPLGINRESVRRQIAINLQRVGRCANAPGPSATEGDDGEGLAGGSYGCCERA